MLDPLFRQALTLHSRLAIRADDAARRFRQSGRVEDLEHWNRLNHAAQRAGRRMTRRFIAQALRPTTGIAPTSR